MKWKMCVNTFIDYEDGQDLNRFMDLEHNSNLRIPPRTVVILQAEQQMK